MTNEAEMLALAALANRIDTVQSYDAKSPDGASWPRYVLNLSEIDRDRVTKALRAAARPAPAAGVKQTCVACKGKGGRHGDGFDHHFYTCEKCNGTGLGNSAPSAGVIDREAEIAAETIHNHWQNHGKGPAHRSWAETCEKFPPQAEDFRRKGRAVVLALMPTMAGEPVAWRGKFTEKGAWEFTNIKARADFWVDGLGMEIEPLYAHPAPSGRDPYRYTKVTEEPLMPQMSDVNYAELLRLSRRHRLRSDEPLWETFIRIGQQLEKTKSPRCGKCFRTDLEYSRLVGATCDDPFHTEYVDFLKSHQQQVANLLDETERLRKAAPSGRDPATIELCDTIIEMMKESGHCGESTSEMIARQRRDATLDAAQKAIRALAAPPQS